MSSDEKVVTPKKKSIHFFVDPEFHKKLKVAVAIKGTTIREYVMSLVEADLTRMTTRGEKPEL